MKAIFSSTIYRASTPQQQAKIRTALADPVNMELVQQLRSYLDEPYQDPAFLNPPESSDTEHKSSESNEPTADDTYMEPDTSDASEVKAPRPVSHFPKQTEPPANMNSISSEPSEEAEPDSSNSQPKPDEGSTDSADTEDQEVQTSTSVNSSRRCHSDVSSLLDPLKGSLNARQDTCGVNRIIKRDDELWVYYDDKVNLNNVMGSVIELVNALGYNNLEFNRLARSDNAIVFQIVVSSSTMNPMENEDE